MSDGAVPAPESDPHIRDRRRERRTPADQPSESSGTGVAGTGTERVPQRSGATMRQEAKVRDTAHLYDPAGPDFDDVGETRVDDLIAEIIESLGEDVSREGLTKTPQRVERSLRFLTSGYGTSVESVVNDAVFATEASEMVVVKGIEFYSLCEHHMLPFFGQAHISYIPNNKILGLSKFARIVDVFARRMQIQERMTAQIADALVEVLEPQGVAVVTEASHLCMMMRGVEKQGSTTRTAAMRGVFKTNERTRHEFLEHIRS